MSPEEKSARLEAANQRANCPLKYDLQEAYDDEEIIVAEGNAMLAEDARTNGSRAQVVLNIDLDGRASGVVCGRYDKESRSQLMDLFAKLIEDADAQRDEQFANPGPSDNPDRPVVMVGLGQAEDSPEAAAEA